jgi:hypothetical protein
MSEELSYRPSGSAATRWRTVRAFGGNPLVRISDRIEAMVGAVATGYLAVGRHFDHGRFGEGSLGPR